MNNKFLKPALALGLVAAMGVGGTLAYITDTTDKIDNKFQIATAGKDNDEFLDISLEETFEVEGEEVTDIAKFLPGDTIVKAPVVSLDKLDTTVLTEGAYIFAELSSDVDAVLALGFVVDAEGWTAVEGTTNVYYRTYSEAVDATAVKFDLFSTDEITIPGTYDEKTFDTVNTLSVQAYAIQANNLDTAELAWDAVK